MPILINCMPLLPEASTFKTKLCHEVQFDQLFKYLGNTMLGFSIVFNYFSRILANKQAPACLVTFNIRPILPWERDGNPRLLRFGSMLFRPWTYYRHMDKIDLFTVGMNAYTKSL